MARSPLRHARTKMKTISHPCYQRTLTRNNYYLTILLLTIDVARLFLALNTVCGWTCSNHTKIHRLTKSVCFSNLFVPALERLCLESTTPPALFSWVAEYGIHSGNTQTGVMARVMPRKLSLLLINSLKCKPLPLIHLCHLTTSNHYWGGGGGGRLLLIVQNARSTV